MTLLSDGSLPRAGVDVIKIHGADAIDVDDVVTNTRIISRHPTKS